MPKTKRDWMGELQTLCEDAGFEAYKGVDGGVGVFFDSAKVVGGLTAKEAIAWIKGARWAHNEAVGSGE